MGNISIKEISTLVFVLPMAWPYMKILDQKQYYLTNNSEINFGSNKILITVNQSIVKVYINDILIINQNKINDINITYDDKEKKYSFLVPKNSKVKIFDPNQNEDMSNESYQDITLETDYILVVSINDAILNKTTSLFRKIIAGIVAVLALPITFPLGSLLALLTYLNGKINNQM